MGEGFLSVLWLCGTVVAGALFSSLVVGGVMSARRGGAGAQNDRIQATSALESVD